MVGDFTTWINNDLDLDTKTFFNFKNKWIN